MSGSCRPTFCILYFLKIYFKIKVNLLFFGNFHEMKLEDYQAGMKEMMNDSEFLYASMTRDIYFLGKVLGKKYKLLRIAYNIFMFGLIAAVLAYIISYVAYGKLS